MSRHLIVPSIQLLDAVSQLNGPKRLEVGEDSISGVDMGGNLANQVLQLTLVDAGLEQH